MKQESSFVDGMTELLRLYGDSAMVCIVIDALSQRDGLENFLILIDFFAGIPIPKSDLNEEELTFYGEQHLLLIESLETLRDAPAVV